MGRAMTDAKISARGRAVPWFVGFRLQLSWSLRGQHGRLRENNDCRRRTDGRDTIERELRRRQRTDRDKFRRFSSVAPEHPELA